MSSRIIPGEVIRLSPLVRRITQENAGILTGPGTNTYLIGSSALYVLDPGADSEDHFRALIRGPDNLKQMSGMMAESGRPSGLRIGTSQCLTIT